uniref:RING-type domain-containing protein n=1 Tax=Kalmanozyma brasiliensis (strain GHG001) TaxID=1365824 RepID=V5EIK1_KALBG
MPRCNVGAVKKARNTRREREEAATLFGPNLANYFGSGISSSGAVSSHGAGVPQPPAIASPISPTAGNDESNAAASGSNALDQAAGAASVDASYPQGSVASRRARLGSRGRARGASLSGLSMMSLGAESVTSLGGVNAERTNDSAQPVGMMQGSTADLIDQLNRDGPSADGSIAMSEGVDITTLQRWIQRSTGVADDASNAAAATPATYGPPVCTTLQSFVNLKRNTLKLSAKSSTEGKPSDASDANLLRSRSSFSVLPTLPYASGAAPAGRDILPEPTHSLYFEYDCAAPYASVQIFIRASRKHGTWINWTPPSATSAADPLTSQTDKDAWLAQSGPPPHVLGWPVHVAKIKKGFGSAHTANIPLHLQFYAPPKAKKLERPAAGGESDKDADKPGVAFKRALEPPTPVAIPETPGFEFNRRLEMDADDAEEDVRPGRGANAGQGSRTDPLGAAAALGFESGSTAQPPVEEETKEQRLAREKAERETLKVAIVVEALDENARPLREPNLQTSYLRLTSLPAKKSVGERLEELTSPTEGEVGRVWSSQVEGQEAEIGPHRFQLQELYGLSSKPPAVAPAPVDAGDGEEDGAAVPPPPVDIDASNGSECLICLSSPPTTLLLPCTHGLCLECAVQLRDSVVGIRASERRRGRTPRRKYACPVCRRAYTSMLHLSKADEKAVAQR